MIEKFSANFVWIMEHPISCLRDKRLKNLLQFAYAQLIIDTLVVTAIIYATGGIESIFSFLYILAIINGSIILYRRGGMIVASSSSILYGLLLDLHYYGAIHQHANGDRNPPQRHQIGRQSEPSHHH